MVAKKTTKKPAAKKVAKTKKTVKPAVKKEEVVQTTACPCAKGEKCACPNCNCKYSKAKSFIVLMIIIIATVIATLVVVGPCKHRRAGKAPCPFAEQQKDGKKGCKRCGRAQRDARIPAPVAEAK